MARLARAVRPARGVTRSSPRHDDTITNDDSVQPHQPAVHIDVTFALRRPLVWLLTGVTIGTLRLPDGLLHKASLILQALVSK